MQVNQIKEFSLNISVQQGFSWSRLGDFYRSDLDEKPEVKAGQHAQVISSIGYGSTLQRRCGLPEKKMFSSESTDLGVIMTAETEVTIYGDVNGTLESKARGQTLVGIDGVINIIYGDAFLIENMKGGNDVLIGGENSFNFLCGDASGLNNSKGGNDVIKGGAFALVNQLYGDSYQMSYSQGGNDVLTGGFNTIGNFLYGDAYQMSYSQGGNDVLTGGFNTFGNFLYGDAFQMSYSQGGNDVLIGGVAAPRNFLNGDAYQMSYSRGGNDVLTGGAETLSNDLNGDAELMSYSHGGNDVLTGGPNSRLNMLHGDATAMSDSQGGNDTLIASDNPVSGAFVTNNELYGDAKTHLAGQAICGSDRLISGTGNDTMWGDIAYSDFSKSPIDLTRVTTGQDVFVFSANNGTDTINDFRQGEDKIELNGLGVTSFDALMAESHLQSGGTNTVITFGSNTITVVGVTELTASDFLFT